MYNTSCASLAICLLWDGSRYQPLSPYPMLQHLLKPVGCMVMSTVPSNKPLSTHPLLFGACCIHSPCQRSPCRRPCHLPCRPCHRPCPGPCLHPSSAAWRNLHSSAEQHGTVQKLKFYKRLLEASVQHSAA
jgi:hypothetical protein